MRNKLFLTLAVAAMASASQAVVVLDQLDFVEANQFTSATSQDFETAQNAFDIIAIDDFTVTAGQLQLTRIEAIVNGFNGFAAANYTNGVLVHYRVEVYSAPANAGANMTGNIGSQVVLPGSATLNNLGWSGNYVNARHLVLPISINLPSAGTYWIGIAARMDFAGGQFGINATNTALGNQNGTHANPGGGFGFSGNVQQGFPDEFANIQQRDLEYRLHAVPEPGSMIALGLGAAAVLARRRRKAA
jgi:hypothetical protein